jgi:predicted nucleotidyltransferase
MELIRNVLRWGNSAGILLPKEYLGNQVKIIFIDRTLEIKKEVLSILEPHLEDIIGIYLIGSYARGEQETDSDIDVMAISKSTKKELISGKYHISIATLEGIKKTASYYPELVIPRLKEAKVILNPQLLEELNEYPLTKKSFKNFVEDTKRIIKMNKEFIELDKLDGEKLESKSIIYSIILRLRGIFLIKCTLESKKYFKEDFKKWVLQSLDKEEFEKSYGLYKAIRDKKNIKVEIKLQTAKKLKDFLIKELKYFETK